MTLVKSKEKFSSDPKIKHILASIDFTDTSKKEIEKLIDGTNNEIKKINSQIEPKVNFATFKKNNIEIEEESKAMDFDDLLEYIGDTNNTNKNSKNQIKKKKKIEKNDKKEKPQIKKPTDKIIRKDSEDALVDKFRNLIYVTSVHSAYVEKEYPDLDDDFISYIESL